jgi:hypothetical protein
MNWLHTPFMLRVVLVWALAWVFCACGSEGGMESSGGMGAVAADVPAPSVTDGQASDPIPLGAGSGVAGSGAREDDAATGIDDPTAAGGTGDSSITLGGAGPPCEVDAILAERCRGCHGDMLAAGAPMPLVDAEDFAAPAVSDPQVRVLDRVAERIHDPARPMPPTGMLESTELATLDAWLQAGAPESADACEDEPGGTVAAGDGGSADATGWAADCETVHEVRAHGVGDTGAEYHVTPDQTDAYICWYFDAPYAGDVQGLQFRSVIDETPVVHHWLLYGTDQLPQPAGTVAPCAGLGTSATLITGWAPGREDLSMPEGVGLQMPTGPGAGLILQIHYYANGMDVMDGSGVDFCTTQSFREHTASISWLGTVNINIAPGAEGTATGVCRPGAQEPIHILRTWPHMHLHGRHASLTVQRSAGGSETLLDQPFNFDFQTSYETPLTLMPGDSIETVCEYQNTADTPATFGEGTGDEMCFAFVYAYPAGALRGGLINPEQNYCLGL